jgi:uncharacterized coiled-coil DUF342 family protein
MNNYINLLGYILTIVLTVVIIKYLEPTDNTDTENKIKTLTYQIDSLQTHVDSNIVKITKLDSVITFYKIKVDEDKKKLSGLKAKADLYKNKYNEEYNRITNLNNVSVISEFTNAFK